MTSGLRITLHTQRSTGLCFCFVVSTAAGAGLEPNLPRDDTLQSQRVCGASSQAGGERMFGRGELEEKTKERRRLIGQNGPSGCFQTRSPGRAVW